MVKCDGRGLDGGLIPTVQDWIERGEGGIDNYVTQFLTGHGSLGTYLSRISKIQEKTCKLCGGIDVPEHLLGCARWEKESREIGMLLQEDLTVDNSSKVVKEGRWVDIKEMIGKIMRQNVREEGQEI